MKWQWHMLFVNWLGYSLYFQNLHQLYFHPSLLFCDNQTAIHIAANLVFLWKDKVYRARLLSNQEKDSNPFKLCMFHQIINLLIYLPNFSALLFFILYYLKNECQQHLPFSLERDYYRINVIFIFKMSCYSLVCT